MHELHQSYDLIQDPYSK